MNISEITISYNPAVNPGQLPRIKSSNDAFDILIDNWDKGSIYHRESFAVLLLNRANAVIGIHWVSVGGTTGTVADPKLIFQAALKTNASAIILAHNHPSGNLKPSANDINLTKKMKNGGNFLDISVLDHLIISETSYYSFADEGLM